MNDCSTVIVKAMGNSAYGPSPPDVTALVGTSTEIGTLLASQFEVLSIVWLALYVSGENIIQSASCVMQL